MPTDSDDEMINVEELHEDILKAFEKLDGAITQKNEATHRQNEEDRYLRLRI